MGVDVFISYPHEDKAVADAACAALEASGVHCWIAPRDILPGTEWSAAVVQAIEQCRTMIMIYSRHANDSQQIHRELDLASGKGIPVLPIRVEDVQLADGLKYFLGSVQWFDALSPPLEEHLKALGTVVNALLQGKPGNGQSREQARTAPDPIQPRGRQEDPSG